MQSGSFLKSRRHNDLIAQKCAFRLMNVCSNIKRRISTYEHTPRLTSSLDQLTGSGQHNGQSGQTDDTSTAGEAALPWPSLLSIEIDMHYCHYYWCDVHVLCMFHGRCLGLSLVNCLQPQCILPLNTWHWAYRLRGNHEFTNHRSGDAGSKSARKCNFATLIRSFRNGVECTKT